MFSDGTLGDSQRTLLTRSLVLQTRDVDQAASVLASSAVPYRSELLAPASAFSTQIFGGHTGSLHLSRVRTTGAMQVRAQLPGDSYAIVLAVSGALEHRVAGELVWVRPGSALVQSPFQPVEVQTPERFELLFLRLDRNLLTCELEKVLGRKTNAPLVFSPSFDVRTQGGRRFRRLVFNLSELLRPGRGLPGSARFDNLQVDNLAHHLPARLLENELVHLLLETQRHNYTRLLARTYDADPWQVRAAEEYISDNAHLTLSLGDICFAAGVNSRTLQHGFQRRRGYTPMQWLRRVRLERVHQDLSRPDHATTVTQAASRWGFLHFGRFAAEYQAHFGEKPSETLLRYRRHS